MCRPLRPFISAPAVLFLVAGLLWGCAVRQRLEPVPLSYPFPPAEAMEETIERLEEKCLSDQASDSAFNLLWELALLYAHPENPAPDYEKAVERMGAAMALLPESAVTEPMRYMVATLERLCLSAAKISLLQKHIETLQATYEAALEDAARKNRGNAARKNRASSRLKEEVDQLKTDNETLRQEAERLKETIETLERLDVQMEEKRRFQELQIPPEKRP